MTADHMDRQARRERVGALFERALGPHWRHRVAAALDRSLPNISRQFSPPAGRDDQPSPEMEALAEFLAGIPPRQWPPRWRDE